MSKELGLRIDCISDSPIRLPLRRLSVGTEQLQLQCQKRRLPHRKALESWKSVKINPVGNVLGLRKPNTTNACVAIDNTDIWQIMAVYAVSRQTGYEIGVLFYENDKQNVQRRSVLYDPRQLHHCGRVPACFGHKRRQQRL